MVGGISCTNNFSYRNVLKVTIPKEVYSVSVTKEIKKSIKEQVKDEYLVVVVPEGVALEIIV